MFLDIDHFDLIWLVNQREIYELLLYHYLGQALTALGAFNNSFAIMEMSRVVFGIGGESLAVAQNTYASAWFKGKALNMVFGFQLSFARVGSTANFQIVGRLFKYLNETLGYSGTNALGWTFTLAGITTIFSLVGAILLGFMDKRRSRILRHDLQEQEKVRNIAFLLCNMVRTET